MSSQQQRTRTSKIYCGMHGQVPSAEHYDRMGNRKECLQKGIGVGKYMTDGEKREIISKSRTRSRVAASEKIYCGESSRLPDGYDRFGRRNECLKVGVGVGVRIQLSDEEKMQQELEMIRKIAALLSIATGRKSRQRLISEITEKLNEL